jgi:hypothetical protein
LIRRKNVAAIRRAGRAGAREFFPRKLKPDWRSEIEYGQTVDEQRIVPVGGLPNNWPQNSTQLWNKDVRFHVSARHALGDRFSGVRGRPFVYENIAKKNLKSARGASAASDQSLFHPEIDEQNEKKQS